ncbi:MAG: hypothetical protein Q9218_006108 [Villophora microphyllina]
MYLLCGVRIWAIFHLLVLCISSALPDLQLPALTSNATVIDLGDFGFPSNDRPTTYSVPGTGRQTPKVTLVLDWHLTKLEQHETTIMIIRSLDQIVGIAIRMSKGDEPILNGSIEFHSAGLKIRAQDVVLLGGFTYGALSAAIRGLGELMDKWGANGVDVTVLVGGKKVGLMDLDFKF